MSGGDMVSIKLRHLVEDVDRHGNVRIYFRRKGERKVRLRGTPGSAAFMAAYDAALRGELGTTVKRLPSNSFGVLCRRYYASPDFRKLDQSTQGWQRRALDRICNKHDDDPVARLQPQHILRLRDELAEATPAAANQRLKALRALFRWAVERSDETGVTRNPAREVERIKYHSEGFHTWAMEEVQQFENRHPLGTKARLAIEIFLATLGRREDAVRIGPSNIVNGRVRFRQAKNEHRAPVDIDVPLLPELAEAITAMKATGLRTLLLTDYGKAFSPAGFGNWFRDRCDEAELPHCSAHGLRKASLTRLADAGATSHELMAWSGHKTLAEVERYTRAADRPKLADSGAAKLAHRKGTGTVPPDPTQSKTWDKKAKKI